MNNSHMDNPVELVDAACTYEVAFLKLEFVLEPNPRSSDLQKLNCSLCCRQTLLVVLDWQVKDFRILES